MLKYLKYIFLTASLLTLITACGLMGGSDDEIDFDPNDFPTDNTATEEPLSPETQPLDAAESPDTQQPTDDQSTTPDPAGDDPEPVPTGICDRTPEVQSAIIELLGIPYCTEINDLELTRIRSLDIRVSHVTPQDLSSLPNLLELKLTGVHLTLESDTFKELKNLGKLTIHSTQPRVGSQTMLAPETFNGLDQLDSLEITIQSGWTNLHFTEHTLKGLQNLQTLHAEQVKLISENAFDKMQKLHTLRMSGTQSSILPTKLFSKLPAIRQVNITGFIWPDSIALNTLEIACLAFTRGFGQEMQNAGVGLEVDGYRVQIQDRMRNPSDTADICRLIINGIQILHVEAPEVQQATQTQQPTQTPEPTETTDQIEPTEEPETSETQDPPPDQQQDDADTPETQNN